MLCYVCMYVYVYCIYIYRIYCICCIYCVACCIHCYWNMLMLLGEWWNGKGLKQEVERFFDLLFRSWHYPTMMKHLNRMRSDVGIFHRIFVGKRPDCFTHPYLSASRNVLSSLHPGECRLEAHWWLENNAADCGRDYTRMILCIGHRKRKRHVHIAAPESYWDPNN